MRLVLIVVVYVLAPVLASAQVAIPRQDVSLGIGWVGSATRTGDYETWDGGLSIAAGAGHYWTDHLKTDIEALWQSRANTYRYEEIQVGQQRVSAQFFNRVSDRRVSLGQTYQFGRNAWVHPYAGAGVDIIRRYAILDRPAQTAYGYNQPAGRPPTQVVLAAQSERSARTLAAAFLRAGLKMYSSERAFFLTEFKLGFGPEFDHALWKLGMGFDF